MEKLIMIIEKSADHYSSYSQNTDGIYAGGDSVAEVKENVLNAIQLINESYKEKDIPELLKRSYEIIYKYDMASFLSYYSKILSLAGLERLTGINQGQLSHYITGHRRPSKKTVEKIQNAIHRFGNEISQVDFV